METIKKQLEDYLGYEINDCKLEYDGKDGFKLYVYPKKRIEYIENTITILKTGETIL